MKLISMYVNEHVAGPEEIFKIWGQGGRGLCFVKGFDADISGEWPAIIKKGTKFEPFKFLDLGSK